MEGVDRLLPKEARHTAAAALLLVDAFLLLALRRTAAVTWPENRRKTKLAKVLLPPLAVTAVRACIGKVHNALVSGLVGSCQLFPCHLQLLT